MPTSPALSALPRSSAPVLLGLLAAAFVIRLPVLFDSVVDWDESLYLLISDDLLRGVLPYQETWDHKPPGIFYVFALAQSIFGGGVVAIRLLGTLSAALGAYGLHQLLRLLWPQNRAAGTAALAYILLFAANGGLATNTEVVFGALVIGGFYAGLVGSSEGTRSLAWWVMAGIAFGLAFGIKYVAAFDLLGFAALHIAFVRAARDRSLAPAMGQTIRAGLVVFASFTLTLVAMVLPFIWSGTIADIYEYTLVFNARYASTSIHGGAILQGLNALLAFSGAGLAALALVFWREAGLRLDPRSLGIGLAIYLWLAFDVLSVLFQGRLFPHHCLQLVAPLALLFGVFADLVQERVSGARRASRGAVAVFLLLALTLMGPIQELGWRSLRLLRNAVAGDLHRDDLPFRIAREIRSDLRPGEAIYVYNDQHVIYHLAEARIPTRYPFALHLQHELVAEGMGFDAAAEVRRIMASQPRYVVVREDASTNSWRAYSDVAKALADDYDRVACYPIYERGRARPVDVIFRMQPKDGRVALYRLRPADVPPAEPSACAES